jgi:hypothetical protein
MQRRPENAATTNPRRWQGVLAIGWQKVRAVATAIETMKTILLILAALGLLQAAPSGSAAKPTLSARQRVIETAASQIGVQERTGKNDGEVDKYLSAVGLGGTRNPYCAAYVYWVGKTALGTANPFPRSAWSPDFLNSPTWLKGRGTIPRPGDTFGIYFPSKGRVAHTGLVWVWGKTYVRTIEANTSPDAAAGSEADRNGDGVWSKYRRISTIYATKSFLP